MHRKRKQFREELLPATLQHAYERVTGYRELWGDVSLPDIGVDQLSELPLTSKPLFAKNPDSYRDISLPSAAVQHTGGTTKKPLVMHRSLAELTYVSQFFTEVLGDRSEADTPLCISVLGNFHGDPTPMPYPGATFSLDVNDMYWDLEHLFTDPSSFMGRPIKHSILVGLESQLRILTCRLVESGFDFTQSNVISIHSTGDFITDRLKRFYENTWGSPLTSRYSMSEIIGGAERCSMCGYYHCDPHVIPEVVDAKSGDTLSEGIGILVLTSLFPFVQKQPMIRYRTGDVVKLGGNSCSKDTLSFEICGREMHTVFDPIEAGRALILGTDLYEIIDGIPDVALSEFNEMFKSTKGLSSHQDLGHPKYALNTNIQSDRTEIKITLELRYLPYLYPERAEKVRQLITEKIASRSPSLAKCIHDEGIMLDVCFALPGQLAATQIDETE